MVIRTVCEKTSSVDAADSSLVLVQILRWPSFWISVYLSFYASNPKGSIGEIIHSNDNKEAMNRFLYLSFQKLKHYIHNCYYNLNSIFSSLSVLKVGFFVWLRKDLLVIFFTGSALANVGWKRPNSWFQVLSLFDSRLVYSSFFVHFC